MKRGVCVLAVALLLGVYVGVFADTAQLCTLAVFALSAAGMKWILSRNMSGAVYFGGALLFLIGAVLVSYQGDVTTKELYPYVDEYVEIKAEVTERPQKNEEKVTLFAKITELTFLDERISPMETIRLTCRGQGEELAFGDVFTARVRMNLPSGAENEDGFDYGQYLKTKKIFFTGYVDGKTLTVCGRKEFGVLDYIKQFNGVCGNLIDHMLTEDTAALLKGILLGDKSDMSDELRQALSRSGLAHITAVSGMHVSTLLTLIFALCRLIRVNKRKVGLFAALVVVFFVCLTGASASSVRAGIMAVLAIGAECIYRKADSYTSLAVAAMVIILVWPFAAFDVSFLLSFGAVFGILLFSTRIENEICRLLRCERTGEKNEAKKLLKKALSLIATTFSAQIVTLPIILYFFQEFTLWGVLTNLIVVPLLPFIMLSGILLCIFSLLWEPMALLAAGLGYPFLLLVCKVAVFFGSLSIGTVTFGQITPFFVFVYGLFLVLVHLALERKYRFAAWIPAGTLVALLVVCVVYGFRTADIARVMFINVGQGDSSCISMPHGVDVLIDAGGTSSFQEYYDVGLKTVRPYLLRQGVDSIEYMIASHGHDDHVMGLVSILGETEVGQLLVPVGFGKTEAGEKLLAAARERSVPVRELAAGDQITFSKGAVLDVLMPTKEWAEGLKEEEENERSLVLRFSYGETSFLYTGDLEAEGERELAAGSGEKLQSDVLKVAHHGSKTSTGKAFLDKVQPKYAFIPADANSYGHPDEGVLQRLSITQTEVFRADIHKDVVFTIDYDRILSISDMK